MLRFGNYFHYCATNTTLECISEMAKIKLWTTEVKLQKLFMERYLGTCTTRSLDTNPRYSEY